MQWEKKKNCFLFKYILGVFSINTKSVVQYSPYLFEGISICTIKNPSNKKWTNNKQHIFKTLFPPSKVIFYKNNFHASMTNFMSDWRRRRNRRRKRWKRWSRWRRRDYIYIFFFSLNKLNLQLFTFTFILLIWGFYGISSVQSVAGYRWVRLWLQALCMLEHFKISFLFSETLGQNVFSIFCIKGLWKEHR